MKKKQLLFLYFYPMILITGSTGLVGTHLIAELLQYHQADELKAIYRSDAKKEYSLQLIQNVYGNEIAQKAASISWAKGDILDVCFLDDFLTDVKIIYHSAGYISSKPSDYELMQKINVEGTANIVNLALAKNIEKLCYVSSIATLGKSIKSPITEHIFRENHKDESDYSITKYAAEMEVWRATQEGLNSVIVNPGIILGEGFYTSGSGQIFTKTAKKFPFYINKVTGFVDVKDVARAMVKITQQEKLLNERFILVSENLNFGDVQNKIAHNLNLTPPKYQLKKWLLVIFWLFSTVLDLLHIKKKSISRSSISSLTKNTTYSSKKIETTIDFKFNDLESRIKEISEHYQQKNQSDSG
ncbi:MAG: NAD-dependent epimerase/dehydratase family protein [Bacteroidota bacterium]